MSVQGKISESGQIAEQTAPGVSEARADLVQHLEMGGASISARELADEIYTQVALGNCVVCGVNALAEALTSAFVIRSRAEDRT